MLYIAADHAGHALKKYLTRYLEKQLKREFIDLGAKDYDKEDDFPDFAFLLGKKIAADPGSMGILICGSGQGMAITANRHRGIRAALAWNEEVARLSREHNDANVLCLGARFLTPELCQKIIQEFLQTPFAGGRHADRVAKIDAKIDAKG